MLKEYSIYFEKRKVVLTLSLGKYFSNQCGLFTRYNTPQELAKIIEFFQTTAQVQNVFISGKNIQTSLHDFSDLFHLVKASGGLVQNSRGEYLFIFRSGKWDLPKGKSEEGENIDETALREVSEETGISDLILKDHITNTYHTYKHGHKTILKETYWYQMLYEGNEKLIPQLNEDITDVKWFSENQLKQVLSNTYDTIREVFKIAGIV